MDYTSGDLAKLLGRNARTVRRQCKTLGLGRVCGPFRLYSDADLAALRDYKPPIGNPLMTPGNRLYLGAKPS